MPYVRTGLRALDRGPRPGGHPASRGRGRDLLAAADAADGGDVAGNRAWVRTDPIGVSWLGIFYGGNITGAVFGCLLAGFYLLRVYDMATATYVAVALNVTVAAIALVPWRPARPGMRCRPNPRRQGSRARAAGTWARVSDNRALRDVGAGRRGGLDPSALAGARRHRLHLLLDSGRVPDRPGDRQQPRCITGAAGRVGQGGAGRLPVAPDRGHRLDRGHDLGVTPLLAGRPRAVAEPLVHLPARPACAAFGPSCRRRACGERASRWRSRRLRPAARTPGGWSEGCTRPTRSAPSPRLVFSLLLVPVIGTAGAERVLIGLAAAAALAALMPLIWTVHGRVHLGGAAGLAAALGVACWLAWSVTPVPWMAVAFGRQTASWLARSAPGIVTEVPEDPGEKDVFCTYVGEGTNVTVAVTLTPEGIRSFHGAGKIQASTQPVDMRLQRMLGHLPSLLHKKPESVLVVACGAGITAGTFVLHPDVKRIVICDIEPLVPTIVTPMFGRENYHVVDNIARENPHMVKGKQVEVVYDDGRHFLRTTQEKFDIITSDPIDPWVKGCAALNTVEYYSNVPRSPEPRRSASLWLPINEGNLETAKSVIATFFQVFPHGILWSNAYEGHGYDAVLFGQAEPTVIDVDDLQRRLDRLDHFLVKQSLREVGFGDVKKVITGVAVVPDEAIGLLATYAGQATFLKEWSRGAQINTDRNLRLQYLAGMWLNSNMGERILSSILEHYRFPEETFVGSPETIDALKNALVDEGRRVRSPAPDWLAIRFPERLLWIQMSNCRPTPSRLLVGLSQTGPKARRGWASPLPGCQGPGQGGTSSLHTSIAGLRPCASRTSASWRSNSAAILKSVKMRSPCDRCSTCMAWHCRQSRKLLRSLFRTRSTVDE